MSIDLDFKSVKLLKYLFYQKFFSSTIQSLSLEKKSLTNVPTSILHGMETKNAFT